ncbi:MAG: glycoside hydrolase family 97 N-terminal domain-containing protein, partial [Prevotella sp.]|nr:glycoside hydrolase family 97 N-terminal domain-containing protein [Prevotella sp.]
MNLRRLLFLLMLVPLMATAQTIKSPNGNIVLTFSLDGNGRPTYEMTYKGKAVVKPSHLGLELAKDKHAYLGTNERDLMDGFRIANTETTAFDETWQ